MGGKLVRTIGRARVKIGLMNLFYNMRRLSSSSEWRLPPLEVGYMGRSLCSVA